MLRIVDQQDDTHLKGPRERAKINMKNIMRAVPLKRGEAVHVPLSSVFTFCDGGGDGKLVGSSSSSLLRSVVEVRFPSTAFSRSSASRSSVF